MALQARETVGPEDRVSTATTTMALGVVRAAQARDDEAELLLRQALDDLQAAGFRAAELNALQAFSRFLRERGRDDEAAPLDERLEELHDAARGSARIA